MPAIYLCLDLDGTEDAIAALPDEALFNAKGAGDILAHPLTQGEGWTRHWRAFPGGEEGKKAAMDYAAIHPTLIVIPMDVETTTLEQMP